MLPSGLPEHTLGWALLDWGTKYLSNPDGERMGERWVYSDEQALFMLWFYAVNEKGQFIFRRGMLERCKGWGKSPLLAAMCITELMGPTAFAGWSKEGKPVGKLTPSPLVQIAAISDSQADNTMTLVRDMVANGDIRFRYPRLEVFNTKITHPGSRKLEKVTASPRGREGNRGTFLLMDETHLWVPANQGPQLYEALTRNMIKRDYRWVETTNSPQPGEDSVAELSHNAYDILAARGDDIDILMDSRSAYVADIYDEDTAKAALIEVYGDAVKRYDDEGNLISGWVNIERIWKEINDPQTREAVARRFYFNQIVSGVSSWLNFAEWNACRDASLILEVDEPIALGFKGQIRNGAAVLVACRLTDGALFNLSKPGWQTPDDAPEGWEVSQESLDKHVREVLDVYNVKKMLCDPRNHQILVGEWYAANEGIVEEMWTSSNTKMARAVEQFETAVKTNRVKWNDSQINAHVLNAHIQQTSQGDVIRKDTKLSKRYISGAQAAILALEASVIAIMEGGLVEKDNVFWSV